MVHSCLLYPCSHHHRLRTTSVRVSAPEHFGETNDTGSNLENLVHDLWDGSPKPLKEFPREEAKDLIAGHLVSLVKRALKWFIVVLLPFTFVSDATFAVLKNKELLILSGLFIGVALADFLKELSLDFCESNTKDSEFMRHLIVTGCFFISVKVISPLFNIQGQLHLSRISNGGLMQVVWLAKVLQQTEHVVIKMNKRWMRPNLQITIPKVCLVGRKPVINMDQRLTMIIFP